MANTNEENGLDIRATPTYDGFCLHVQALLGGVAESKGYNGTGVNGHNDLYRFVHAVSGSHAHGIGEIIHKAVRYMRKRNPEDLLKIAAWAYLCWKHHDLSDSL